MFWFEIACFFAWNVSLFGKGYKIINVSWGGWLSLLFFFFFCTHMWGKEGVFCYLVALSSVCLISLMWAWHVEYIDSETSLWQCVWDHQNEVSFTRTCPKQPNIQGQCALWICILCLTEISRKQPETQRKIAVFIIMHIGAQKLIWNN